MHKGHFRANGSIPSASNPIGSVVDLSALSRQCSVVPPAGEQVRPDRDGWTGHRSGTVPLVLGAASG